MGIVLIGGTGPTPLGDIWVAVSELGLVAVEFPSSLDAFSAYLQKQRGVRVELNPLKVDAFVEQLHEYASGVRHQFDLPIDWSILRPYQQKVLRLTFEIPYGETRTYKEIALQMGNPHAARAVGRAQATNPMPIVLPCHRVVGSDGKLHGYGGGQGLPTKEWLLKMEKAFLA